jgi:hypothetical protein
VLIAMNNSYAKDGSADKCMDAFKKICDEADQSELISSEECHYWVFEQGYKAAIREIASTTKRKHSASAMDLATESLMHGFNLLERFKTKAALN